MLCQDLPTSAGGDVLSRSDTRKVRPIITKKKTLAKRIAVAIALMVCISEASVTSALASSQSTQVVYPTFLALTGTGSLVNDSTVQNDEPPNGNLVVKAGKSVSLEGGIENTTNKTQTTKSYFSVECSSLVNTYDSTGPSLSVVVPGDPNLMGGLATMARVKGTLTIPNGCTHDATGSMDGYISFTVNQYGISGAGSQDLFIQIGSSIPGPGFPPAGAVGAITLYRAVDSDELAAIKAAGGKYSLGPGQEGKYFFLTKAEAVGLAVKYEGMGLGDYTVTSATIQDSVLAATSDSISLAGEGTGYFMIEEGVALITEVVDLG